MSIENKYSRPTRLDVDRYGQIRKVICDDGSIEYYIQCSQDEENPLWLRLGSFFEIAFSNYMTDDKFIESALRMYVYNENKPINTINKILEDRSL